MSSSNHCGTCRFWTKTNRDESYYFNLRPCGAVKQREDIEMAKGDDGDEVRDEDGNETPVVRPRAMAVDGSGYFAALRTAEDFGCVLWEPVS